MDTTCPNCCAAYSHDDTRLMYDLLVRHRGCCVECGEPIPGMKENADVYREMKASGNKEKGLQVFKMMGMDEFFNINIQPAIRLLEAEPPSPSAEEPPSDWPPGPPLAPA